MKIFDPKLTGSIQVQSNIQSDVTIEQDLTVQGTINGKFGPSTATAISGAFTLDSSSLASRISDLENFELTLDTTYATDYELGLVDTRVATLEGKTLLSSSAQIASDISGSFTELSSSIASKYLLNTTDTLTGDLTVTGTITAQEFHTEFVSASIIYQSGSTQFGNSSDDTHVFTGSLEINGSGLPRNLLKVVGTANDPLARFESNQNRSHIEFKNIQYTGSLGLNLATMYFDLDPANAWAGPSAMIFSIAGDQKMRIEESGNVGIGTISPDYKLEVESTSDLDLVSLKSTAGANNTQMRLGISGSSSVISGTGGSTGNLVFKTYGSERVRIDVNGNVGIGTTSPSAKLQAKGSSGAQILVDYNGSNENYFDADTTIFRSYGDGGYPERMRIHSGGDISFRDGSTNQAFYWDASIAKLGIGTDTPTSKIHVLKNGDTSDIKISSDTLALLQLEDSGISKVYNIEIGRSATSGDLTFRSSDGEKVRFTESGKVGIGTDNPGHLLRVYGDGTSTGNKVYIESLNTSFPTDTATAFASSSLVIKPHASTSSHMDFFSAGSSGGIGMQVTNYNYTAKWPVFFNPFGGSVGIGTTEPTLTFHVISGGTNISAKFESTDSTAGIQLADSTGNVELTTSSTNGFDVRPAGGSTVFRVHGDGNVGIGTTSPGYKLDVRGNNNAYWNGSSGWTNGIPTAITIVNTNDGGYDPALLYRQTDSGGSTDLAGAIGLVGRASWTAGEDATKISDMYFAVRNNNGGISERMRITYDGFVSIDSGRKYGALSIGKNIPLGQPNKTVDDSHCWNNVGNSHIFIDSGNNAMVIALQRDTNSRKGWIQVGHDSTNYASALGDLALQPLGGQVAVNKFSADVPLDVQGQIRASTGVLFGTDTADANALDDYEEGSWSPQVYYQNSTDQANATNVVQEGKYTKIGNLVYVSFRLDFSQSSSSPANDNIGVKNLPFAGANNHYGAGGNLITSTSITGLNFQLPSASGTSVVIVDSANGGNYGNDFGSGSGKYIRGSFTYLTQ